jgi:YD repeat-containing protein
LVQVQMTRDAATQNRYFRYDANQRLWQTEHPESGITTYTYNPDGSLATRVDAKGQKTAYGYDPFGRLNAIAHHPVATGPADPCQQVTLTYDGRLLPMLVGETTTHLRGRLATVWWGDSWGCTQRPEFREDYAYNVLGQMSGKRLTLKKYSGGTVVEGWLQSDFSWTWGNRLDLISLPYWAETQWSKTTRQYSYDAQGRPTGLVQQRPGWPLETMVNAVGYNPAGQLTTLTYGVHPATVHRNPRLQPAPPVDAVGGDGAIGECEPDLRVLAEPEQRADHGHARRGLGGARRIPVRRTQTAQVGGDNGTAVGPQLHL